MIWLRPNDLSARSAPTRSSSSSAFSITWSTRPLRSGSSGFAPAAGRRQLGSGGGEQEAERIPLDGVEGIVEAQGEQTAGQLRAVGSEGDDQPRTALERIGGERYEVGRA